MSMSSSSGDGGDGGGGGGKGKEEAPIFPTLRFDEIVSYTSDYEDFQYVVNPNLRRSIPVTSEDHDNVLRRLSRSEPPPSTYIDDGGRTAQSSGISKSDPAHIIDFTTMYDPSIHLPDKPNFLKSPATSPAGSDAAASHAAASHAAGINATSWERSTPLLDEVLIPLIGVSGPITVAEYIRLALTHPVHGYYRRKHKPTNSNTTTNTNSNNNTDSNNKLYSTSHQITPKTFGDDIDHDWDIEDYDLENTSNQPDNNNNPIIGRTGDFTTSPEISQVFGESLLIWFISLFRQNIKNDNDKSSIQLVEIGPGRGTLMVDLLRTAITSFPDFANALSYDPQQPAAAAAAGVHLVEVSQHMRQEQQRTLKQLSDTLSDYQFQFFDIDETTDDNDKEHDLQNQKKIIPITWHRDFQSVPSSNDKQQYIPAYIICQEVFDALPVHVFETDKNGAWRERLVDVGVEGAVATPPTEGHNNNNNNVQKNNVEKKPRLRFVSPPDVTLAVLSLLSVDADGYPTKAGTKPIIFPDEEGVAMLKQQIINKNQNKKYDNNDDDNNDDDDDDDNDDNDDNDDDNNKNTKTLLMEVCVEGMALARSIASRIDACSGAALIIDYGYSMNNSSDDDVADGRDTLRAFRRHKQVSVLSLPGEVDVTADVDFDALKSIINTNNSLNNTARAYGPITQGQFLTSMGIVERVVALVENDATTSEQADDLVSALERLISPQEMGERYKVLAIYKQEGDDGVNAVPPLGF